MERETYSTYEAKARFSELLRKVRSNKRIVITHRGKPVAELGPVSTDDETLDEHLARLQDQGTVEPARSGPRGAFEPIAVRPGALGRFLQDRD